MNDPIHINPEDSVRPAPERRAVMIGMSSEGFYSVSVMILPEFSTIMDALSVATTIWKKCLEDLERDLPDRIQDAPAEKIMRRCYLRQRIETAEFFMQAGLFPKQG